jgi:hypothetical protein
MSLFLSLQSSLAHSAALAAKSVSNVVLRRRDLLIEQMKHLLSSHLKGSLHTTPLSGMYLFHDSLPDTVEAFFACFCVFLMEMYLCLQPPTLDKLCDTENVIEKCVIHSVCF